MIKRFIDDRRGVTSIEYGLIAVVISIVIVAGATQIGVKLNSKFLSPVNAGLN